MCRFDQQRDTPVGNLKVYGRNKRLVAGGAQGQKSTGGSSNDRVDLRKRVSMGAWKPKSANDMSNSQTLALVFRNCLYLYNSQNKSSKVGKASTHRR